MYYSYLDSPVGKILVAGDEEGLKRISFPTGKTAQKPNPRWKEDKKPLRVPLAQLKGYFAGKRKSFDLKIAPTGTPFQIKVLKALQKIPYGQTASYSDIARRVGNPNASRAVGAANHRNPLPIVIPCHRVIGKSGSLTGFGGGLPTKKTLLEFEKSHA